ncbi:3-oxoacyl-ACP synthase III family protein [Amycolatopsis samaneae]|uniref:3-oxoacyl-ACP synthase III family protein n=1 Tax=Amycolatopsis samaneae TaxID=664691 RepID=A0ABW5GSX1_9PSEU
MHEPHIGILGTGSHVPAQTIRNEDVARTLDIDAEWISARTGVDERRFAREDEATSDLATQAARAALGNAGVTADQVDCVIVATSTPDEPLPGVACRVQSRINAPGAAAFDVNAVCSGFLYALEIGRSMLRSDRRRKHVLVIGADTYSKILDPTDRRTYPIFGDGAGAVLLGQVAAGEGVLGTELNSDGDLAHYVRVPAGGSRLPISAEQISNGNHYFKMHGRLVRELVEDIFPKMVDDAVAESGLSVPEIDHLICHQANVRLVEECAVKAGFTPEQLVLTGRMLANTAAASIPIALDRANRAGRLAPGDTVLLLTFGGGMSWGRSMLRWSAACAPAKHRLSPSNEHRYDNRV